MNTRKADSVGALVAVVQALEPLTDSERQWVLNSAASRWALAVQADISRQGAEQASASDSLASGQRRGVTPDPAKFLRDKKPGTDKQRVAVLAYFLTHFKGTPEFKKSDIEKMNTGARGGSFNIEDAFSNASKPATNYLSAVGGGKKQLTSFADQVVDALPNQEAVRSLEKTEKPGKRRKKRKTKQG